MKGHSVRKRRGRETYGDPLSLEERTRIVSQVAFPVKFFCDVVTATQDNHMWPPRRDFWLSLYDDKMNDEAWVAFGSSARHYAQRHLVRSGRMDSGRRFGSQLDRGGSTSLWSRVPRAMAAVMAS